MTDIPAKRTRTDERRSVVRRRRWRIGLIVGGLILILAGLYAWKLVSSAVQVRDSMGIVMAQSELVAESVAAGELDEADTQMQTAEDALADAGSAVDGWEWRAIEWVPIVADNVGALRSTITAAQWLVADVARPAIPLVADGLRPKEGKFDVEALRQLSVMLAGVEPAMAEHQQLLAETAGEDLVGPVADGVQKLDALFAQTAPLVTDSLGLLQILPATLGGDGARDYLLMFQGTSEARSLGGNPAVLLQIRVEDGAISITGFANSSDFPSRAEPVMELDPAAELIFGDKIGRWFPDVTMPPDFPYSVELVRAFWNETIGTEIDGVLSMDPTLLSYILASTGPITLSTGDVLTAENAVPLLLNEVYFRYEDPIAQNAFFAEAAAGVFTALTNGAGNPLGLLTALQRGAEEGRLLYAPTDANEAALISGTRATGAMPLDNLEETVLGVYINDNTGSKKSYYLNMGIEVSPVTCDAPSGASEYRGGVTLTSTLSPEVAATLPYYITGPYYLPRVISSYVVIYGPVGGTLTEVMLDGAPAQILTQGTHLGRPVVKVEVLNDGLSRHRVDFVFGAPSGDGGPVAVWNTPMTGDTPVTITDECQ